MANSFSFITPKTSFSTIDLAINGNQNDDHSYGSSHQTTFHSFASSVPKRNRAESPIQLQTLTIGNQTTHNDDEYRNEEEEQRLVSRYNSNRLKQEKILLCTNIFRLLIIFILAPIIYFLV